MAAMGQPPYTWPLTWKIKFKRIQYWLTKIDAKLSVKLQKKKNQYTAHGKKICSEFPSDQF